MEKKGFILGLAIVLLLLLGLYTTFYLNPDEPTLSNPTLPFYEPVIISPEKIADINNGISEQDYKQVSGILINNQLITPVTNVQSLKQLSDSEHTFFIIQFIGPVKEEWKQELEQLNVKFYDYLPLYSYKVYMRPEQIPEILKLNFISNIVEYTPELKIEAETQKKLEKMSDRQEITLYLETFNPSPELENALEQYSNAYVKESPNSYQVKIDKYLVDNIANLEETSIIEEMKPVFVTNDFSADIVEADPTATTLNLDGSGQKVAIIDSGIDTGVDAATVGDMHLDLDNRVFSITTISNVICQIYGASCTSANDVNGHGTHTSGSILGNGTRSSSQYKGMAPKATLSFYAAGDDAGSRSMYIASLDTTMIQQGYNDGAKIHSDSWGSGTTEYSSALAKRMDSFMWDNKDLLIVVSAGNDGPGGQTVRDPGTAKNVLTVGASQSNRSGSGYGTDINTIASFSSIGPANDNRTKPDVVAPGTNIISTRSSALGGSTQSCSSAFDVDGYYSTCSGTSMSTPLTAGYATLVRENFVENINYAAPAASLIKAMIINGAQNTGYGIPSNTTGWGRINLTNTLIPTYPRFFKYVDNNTGFSASNQYNLHTFNVINNTVDLKITLVWTDFESTSTASINLVNDLDIVVTSPNGTKYYGNNFVWPYNTSQDRLNNVEQLTLSAASSEVETGTYTINVSAYSISQTGQTYSLVASGGLNVSPTSTRFNGATTAPNTGLRYNRVSGFVVENTSNGRIRWNSGVYVSDMNFDRNIIISRNNIWANTSGLHSTLNTTNMTIALYNLNFVAPMPMKDGQACTSCSLANSSAQGIEFYATGFSNYSASENTSLDVWDMLDAKPQGSVALVYQNQETYFYANYSNYSSSLPVTGASCNITFNDSASSYTMSYNATISYYQYNRTFANAIIYSYNISCSAANFYPRTSSNSTTISDINAVYPWMPTNHSITLNANGSVALSWNTTKDAGSYGIFYDSDLAKLWSFNDSSTPNITGINGVAYTDNNVIAFSQRYYKIVAENSTTRINASNVTLAVFRKEVPVTTGNPNSGVDMAIVSIPLNMTSYSVSSIISSAQNNDIIYTYNITTLKPESLQFFTGFGWLGEIAYFNPHQGYVFKPAASSYNITFVGFVPVVNGSFNMVRSTGVAGNISNSMAELNMIGLNTPLAKCDLDTIFSNATSGDTLYRYNITTQNYETASFNGTNWIGGFDCMLPGEGYEARRVQYNQLVNYAR